MRLVIKEANVVINGEVFRFNLHVLINESDKHARFSFMSSKADAEKMGVPAIIDVFSDLEGNPQPILTRDTGRNLDALKHELLQYVTQFQISNN